MPTANRTATPKIIQFPLDASQARDELNLCEFPMAVLASRAPDGCHELNFSDSVWDESKQEQVERNLVISAPAKYGLPTAKDEEVLLALIHLTDQVNRFENQTVPFSRFELIKLLGWDDGGKSYQRIRESMARWKAVTFDYRNAWRDHKHQSWVSEQFSIIDNVKLYERDTRHARDGSGQLNLPLSSFIWNRVFFDSMQAKYFKRLDFGFHRKLSTPTAKRMFRFLDKRFWQGRHRCEFDLQEFAFEHIGLSRNYNTGKIKSHLRPAIEELEAEGYLEPLPLEERFRKDKRQWRVVFARAKQPSARLESPLAVDLTTRGISPTIAAELARDFTGEQIKKQLEYFDWIVEHGSELRNPAGFLRDSIRQDFAPPAGFKTREEQDRADAVRKEREAAQSRKKAAEQAKADARTTERQKIAELRASLSEDELAELEAAAIEAASDADRLTLANSKLRKLHLEILVDQLLLRQAPHLSTVKPIDMIPTPRYGSCRTECNTQPTSRV